MKFRGFMIEVKKLQNLNGSETYFAFNLENNMPPKLAFPVNYETQNQNTQKIIYLVIYYYLLFFLIMKMKLLL